MTKNKKYLLFVFVMVLLIPFTVSAAKGHVYIVYSVIGDVYKINGGTKSKLSACTQLEAAQNVQIPKGCAVTLLDRESNKMYSSCKIGTNTVSNLVESVANPKSLSSQYMGYIVKLLFEQKKSKDIHPNAYMQSTATSYRSATNNDSTFLNAVLKSIRSSFNSNYEQTLRGKGTVLSTSYNVNFDIISCVTGMPVAGRISGGESCYFRIRNKSNTPLYCNVLNIDSLSNKSLLLPIDSAMTCSNLIVPSDGEVDFKSEPFVFSTAKSLETFLLLATEEPVNFSVLLVKKYEIINSNKSEMPVGIFRKFVYSE
ncbi:MAG: hypothetical protein LKF31_08540 [Muribaculaceae bacterium]|jgi:hypothetical protein|nr:hypothetical protein [Muribaculaceae bacterium]